MARAEDEHRKRVGRPRARPCQSCQLYHVWCSGRMHYMTCTRKRIIKGVIRLVSTFANSATTAKKSWEYGCIWRGVASRASPPLSIQDHYVNTHLDAIPDMARVIDISNDVLS